MTAVEAVEAAVLPKIPYCGIQSFRYTDRAIFFGREQETTRLTSLVSVYRGVMLYGESGAGKSSLVNAALLPRLVEDGFRPERVRVQPQRGGELVVGRIATDDDGTTWLPSALAGDDGAERVVLSIETFEQRVEAACARGRTLLVFDQFEELCTLFATREERATRRRIVDLIVRLMRGPVEVKLLFVFRSDYLAAVKDLLGACPELVDQALLLAPLVVGALPIVIRGPFEHHPGHYGRELGPALAARLCAAFATRFGPGEISLSEVQTVCLRLWQAENADALFEQRGVQGLLEDALGEALDDFPTDVRFASIALLGQMVTGAGTRNVVSADDLVQRVRDDDPTLSLELVAQALAQLEDRTRLVRRERRRDLDLYEITSEFLVPWISARRAEAEGARALQRVRRRQRVLVVVAVLLTLVVAVVGSLAVWALRQRSDAQRAAASATGMALAGGSIAERYDRLDVSLLLALGGYSARPGPQEQDALVTALQRAAGFEGILHGGEGQLFGVALDTRHGLVAAAGSDDTVRLWSLATHRQVGVLRGHASAVQAVAFSPDGRLLASGGADGTVRLWNVAARRQLGSPLRPRGRISNTIDDVAFSPDGRVLASTGYDGAIRLWSVRRHRQVWAATLAPRTVPEAVAYSPDGRTLAIAEGDGTVRLWSVAAHRQLGRPLSGGLQSAMTVAFSPDGSELAVGGSGAVSGAVRLWSVATRRQLGAPLSVGTELVKAVAFSPDGRVLASADWNGSVRLWSVATHQQLGGLLNEQTGAVQGLAFGADGRTLAVANWDGSVRLHDVVAPHLLESTLGGSALAPSSSGGSPLHDLAFSPAGRLLAVANWNNTVQLWDVARQRKVGTPLRYPDGSFQSIAFSPDGRTLAAIGFSGVRMWDVATRRPAAHLVPTSASSSSSAQWVTSVFVSAGAFSPDGRTFATGDTDGPIRLWDMRRQRQLGRPLRGTRGEVGAVAFSPDGRLLASAGLDRTIRLWSVTTHRQVGILRGNTDAVLHIAFSPDGRLLASGGADGSVRLWDVGRRRQLGPELTGQGATVLDVAFSPNGDLLASLSGDEMLRLWNVGDRTPFGPPLSGAAGAVAFSPDGLTLATGGLDSAVHLWRGFLWHDFGALEQSACRTVGGDLTRSEWAHYVPGVPYRRICGS